MSDQPELLRIVRGDPTAEELAALTALATASSGANDEQRHPRRGTWNDPAARLRTSLRPGPGGWRAASLP